MDAAIKEFTLHGVLDVVPKNFDKWSNDCEPLNDISTYQLASYIIEGYSYPKSTEESLEIFVNWINNYNTDIPLQTKNSSYRKGRREVLTNIESKLNELGLLGGK